MKREQKTDKASKPACRLTGQDGNVFNLIGIAVKALQKAGMNDKALEMRTRIYACGSYDEALAIICEYVEAH